MASKHLSPLRADTYCQHCNRLIVIETIKKKKTIELRQATRASKGLC